MKTCSVCQGNKQIRGLGMMKEDCHGCNGLGEVEEIVLINDIYIPTQEEMDNPHPGTIMHVLKYGETIDASSFHRDTVIDVSAGNCTVIGETSESIKPKSIAKSKTKARKK